jgi:alpha-D-ribose 1-methylphosphonate 5-triphosphate synthase subunit PhnL
MALLDCEQVSKEFVMHVRGGRKVLGFPPVSFSVRKGDFLGVTGPSGIGKSSLLKCIYRTYLPTSGSILYTSKKNQSIDIASADDHTILNLRRSDIGYVSQFFHVIPRISALETVAQVYISRGFSSDEAKDNAAMLLKRLQLPESIWDLFPSTFSGGEKQRLNIIHAIASEPRLLLLDEPTASLDTLSTEKVTELIKELKYEGTTMIGVFHDRRVIDQLADTRLEFTNSEKVGV